MSIWADIRYADIEDGYNNKSIVKLLTNYGWFSRAKPYKIDFEKYRKAIQECQVSVQAALEKIHKDCEHWLKNVESMDIEDNKRLQDELLLIADEMELQTIAADECGFELIGLKESISKVQEYILKNARRFKKASLASLELANVSRKEKRFNKSVEVLMAVKEQSKKG
jgi:hypothetical protein